jgi:hypothetical protein
VLLLFTRYAELRYGPPSAQTLRAQDIRAFRQSVARLSLPRGAVALSRT